MTGQDHIVIDGFNVIFGDASLKQLFAQSPDAAKEQLLKLAQVAHDADGCQVTVVFDGRGKRLQIEHPLRDEQFTVVHSPANLSADGVIERMVSRSRFPDRLLVVSNDHMIRDAAIACGAGVRGVGVWIEHAAGGDRRGQSRKRRIQEGIDNRIPL